MQTYFYRVDEFVKTRGRSEGAEESFSHSLDFKFDTIHESKKQAYDYYTERLQFLQREDQHFLPFVPRTDTNVGLIAVYTLILYFVECFEEDEYCLHGLEGVPESERLESLKIEDEVLSNEDIRLTNAE